MVCNTIYLNIKRPKLRSTIAHDIFPLDVYSFQGLSKYGRLLHPFGTHNIFAYLETETMGLIDSFYTKTCISKQNFKGI